MMMYKNKFLSSIIFILLLIWGCKKEKVTPYDPRGKGSVLVSGKVDIPKGASIKYNDLIIKTSADTSSVKDDGSFTVDVLEIEGFQLLTACVEGKEENPVFLLYGASSEWTDGGSKGDESEFKFSAKSTALSLCLMNPMFIGASESQKKQIRQKVIEHPDFSALVSKVEEIIKSDPYNLINYAIHPEIYDDATRIAYDILEEAKFMLSKAAELRIEDGPGNKLKIVNSINLYYGSRRTERGYETNPNYRCIPSGDARWAWQLPPWTREEVSLELDGSDENVLFFSAGFVGNFLTERTRLDGTLENLMKGTFMIANIIVPLFTGIPLPQLESYHASLVAHKGGRNN
jgi:hypothetical protein